MKRIISLVVVLVCLFCTCVAETCYKANTDVYVRSADDGSIVGMFEKNDAIPVSEKHGGWYYFSFENKNYKVWSEYVSEYESDTDSPHEPKIKKSRSAGEKDKNGVYKNTVKKAKITPSSPFADINPF